ncbi:MAG: hypothetical protein R3D71_03860 [Rickettsiales bacterium]
MVGNIIIPKTKEQGGWNEKTIKSFPRTAIASMSIILEELEKIKDVAHNGSQADIKNITKAIGTLTHIYYNKLFDPEDTGTLSNKHAELLADDSYIMKSLHKGNETDRKSIEKSLRELLEIANVETTGEAENIIIDGVIKYRNIENKRVSDNNKFFDRGDPHNNFVGKGDGKIDNAEIKAAIEQLRKHGMKVSEGDLRDLTSNLEISDETIKAGITYQNELEEKQKSANPDIIDKAIEISDDSTEVAQNTPLIPNKTKSRTI